MKKIITPLLFTIFAFGNLCAQNEPVKLCAQVETNGLDVTVNLIVNDFVNISSYQFGVAWEAEKYDFVAVENLHEQVPASYNQEFYDIPEEVGLVRTLWFDETAINPQTVEDGSLLYSVKLSRNDENINGLVGIAPAEDFLIEFSDGNVGIVDYVLDQSGCSVLSFQSLTNTSDVNVKELSVSPNPFTSDLNITLDESSNGKFSIYSTTGKLVEQFTYNNDKMITLPLENLESGTYILSYESEDGKTLGKSKIVKL